MPMLQKPSRGTSRRAGEAEPSFMETWQPCADCQRRIEAFEQQLRDLLGLFFYLTLKEIWWNAGSARMKNLLTQDGPDLGFYKQSEVL